MGENEEPTREDIEVESKKIDLISVLELELTELTEGSTFLIKNASGQNLTCILLDMFNSYIKCCSNKTMFVMPILFLIKKCFMNYKQESNDLLKKVGSITFTAYFVI
ncbi:14_t:CDS:2, partial [Cetraspora pellucida]